MILKAFVELDVHFNAHAKEKISLLMAERGTIIQKFNFIQIFLGYFSFELLFILSRTTEN